ncbi:MAG: hypothetical protein NC935_02260 [Candidatus Omnitrophica bacterium]|nr:hypothetical protein [Candidatus Omnitrophota bacterium]
MVNIFTREDKDYNRFNLQMHFLSSFALLDDVITTNLAKSFNGSISGFRTALGRIGVVKSKIEGVKLTVDKRDLEVVELNLTIAKKLGDYNIEEATQYLFNAYEILLSILRRNNLIFPKSKRSLSFKSFVDEEIG